MNRIAVVSSEPVRPHMAGIGLRYAEFARRLTDAGLEVLLLSPAPAGAAAAAVSDQRVQCERFESSNLGERIRGCAAVVAQGQLANDVLLAAPAVPAAIDLYDPWLVENLHYAAELGFDPYRNDHATWLLQLAKGDFFLCSSVEQRLFYLGFLTALGRVNPLSAAADPDLKRLIDIVPFGVPAVLPPHSSYLPPRDGPEARIFFGAVYDWYEPWTLLAALETLDPRDRPWQLILVRHANAAATPQRLIGEIERWCRQRGWLGEDDRNGRVRFIDWVPAERRFDVLRDVDVLAATHAPGLETDLAMRTRYLDALAAGCPVLTSSGGSIARLLERDGSEPAGWVVPAGDVAATATALREAIAPGPRREARIAAGSEVARAFRWDQVIQPLVRFCSAPWRDQHKIQFDAGLKTVAPPDRFGFRLRRFARRFIAPSPGSP